MTYGKDTSKYCLWSDHPADGVFTRSYPLGNGWLGAMISGDAAVERIGINEGTIWSGGPSENNRDGASEWLAPVRQALFSGDFAQAEQLVQDHMIGRKQQSFLPAGALELEYPGHERVQDYRRRLDLNQALASVEYKIDGVQYRREYFASHPDRVLIVRISADHPGSVCLNIGYVPVLPETEVYAENTGELVVCGMGITRQGIEADIQYCVRTRIMKSGGQISFSSDKITVQDADSVLICTAIATNFKTHADVSGNSILLSRQLIEAAVEHDWENLLQRHLDDYQPLFERVDFSLGQYREERTLAEDIPTEQLRSPTAGRDVPELVETYYQFGRYLLIASSRAGGQPANLQGIWNAEINPPWDSKYTVNINFQMNYWPVMSGNLAECAVPFIEKILSLVSQGQKTAAVQYNIQQGWVLHHNTDLWNQTGPIDGPWGQTPVMGAWLCNQLYDLYLFTCSREYLNRIYPVLSGAARFFELFLVPYENAQGKTVLTTAPSASPENKIACGINTCICFAPTLDNQVLRDLYNACLDASVILNRDEPLRRKWQEIRDCLPATTVGRYGQIQEWLEDWDNPNDDHRHISHLYGLFPSSQITPEWTPELAQAARVTLDARGDMSTGWSLAWKINTWARLQDGNHCLELINLLLSPERTYPNLLDAHPPFQIDGNFGAVSGINEMLVQSHLDCIHLFPALPQAWPDGKITGLRARGGYIVEELSWHDSLLVRAVIYSRQSGICNVRYADLKSSWSSSAGERYLLGPDLQPILIEQAAD